MHIILIQLPNFKQQVFKTLLKLNEVNIVIEHLLQK